MKVGELKRGDIIHNDKTKETLIFRNDYAISSPNLCGIDCRGIGVLRNNLQDFRKATKEESQEFMKSLENAGWKWEEVGLIKIRK